MIIYKHVNTPKMNTVIIANVCMASNLVIQ